jgi:hypothetical protein
MEEYKQWLEQQIERCLNDKDLQREHWAFCNAYEKFTALRQPPVMLSLPDDEEIGKKAHEWLKANYGKYKPSEWRAFIESAIWMRELSKCNGA